MGRLRERLKRLEELLRLRKKPVVFDVILEDDVPPGGEKDEGTEKENRKTGANSDVVFPERIQVPGGRSTPGVKGTGEDYASSGTTPNASS